MDANSLLTFFAIMIAGYTVLPEEKRLDLSLTRTKYHVAAGTIWFIALLWIIYLPVCQAIGLALPWPWALGFDKSLALFTGILVMLCYVVFRYKVAYFPKSAWEKWERLAYKLTTENKVPVLCSLYNTHCEQIIPLVKSSPERMAGLRDLFRSRRLLNHLADNYPLCALKTVEVFNDEELIEAFFKRLLENKESALYVELRHNQNCSYTGRYYISDRNEILSYLFANIDVADRIYPSKGIGNYVTEYVSKQRGQDNIYNQPIGNYMYGGSKWECPIFVSIFFFKLMIMEAIFQRNKDHMWLMYVTNFVEEILKSLDQAEEADDFLEFPTRFDLLLYECVSTASDWAESVLHLKQPFPEDAGEHWEALPEGMSAACFGDVLHLIFLSDKVNDSKKRQYLELLLRSLKKFDDRESLYRYRDRIITHVLSGPANLGLKKAERVLPGLYGGIDHILRRNECPLKSKMEELFLQI